MVIRKIEFLLLYNAVLALTILGQPGLASAKAEKLGSGPSAWGNIFTVAGNGQAGYSGDGGPSTLASLRSPLAVEELSDGSFLVADSGNGLIRQVKPGGVIDTVAGNGYGGCPRDGERAIRAAISNPIDIAMSSRAGYYFVSFLCDAVYRVSSADPDEAVITRVAGDGSRGFSGDGGRATEAQLSFPSGIVETYEGGLLIADQGNRRVRYVDPDGTIDTVAGNGSADCSDYDGSSALDVSLSEPAGLAIRQRGFNPGFYIADWARGVVSYVDSVTGGRISRVAGQPCSHGFSGDGGSPRDALLNHPSDVVEMPDRSILIADQGSARIREVDRADQAIWTVAGNGEEGSLDDWIPARESGLSLPRGVSLSVDGGFFIADTGTHRARYVEPWRAP